MAELLNNAALHNENLSCFISVVVNNRETIAEESKGDVFITPAGNKVQLVYIEKYQNAIRKIVTEGEVSILGRKQHKNEVNNEKV